MGKLSHYLKLIPEAMKNLPKVAEALANNVAMEFGYLKEDEQAEILRRRLICSTCPYMSNNAKTSKEYLELTGEHYNPKWDDDHCSFCGCPIETRTAGLSSNCGIQSYNKKNPNNILKLKWEKYEPDDSRISEASA